MRKSVVGWSSAVQKPYQDHCRAVALKNLMVGILDYEDSEDSREAGGARMLKTRGLPHTGL